MITITRKEVRMMRVQDAIRALIRGTEADLRGSGCGLRSLPEGEMKKEYYIAIAKMFKRAFGYPMPRGYAGIYFEGEI